MNIVIVDHVDVKAFGHELILKEVTGILTFTACHNKCELETEILTVAPSIFQFLFNELEMLTSWIKFYHEPTLASTGVLESMRGFPRRGNHMHDKKKFSFLSHPSKTEILESDTFCT